MKFTKPVLYTYTAALTLGALSMSFAPAAQAVSIYDASSSFTLTLTGLTGVAGGTAIGDWDVIAFGSGDVFLNESGDASAAGSISIADPAISLGINESFTQSSNSSGTATNGLAATDALTDLDITVSNLSDQAITFSFDWSFFLDASATGDADANASIDFLDDFRAVDILATVTHMTASSAQDGSFSFTLDGGEVNVISGFVDSFGSAASVVPVPAAVWLFGSGLLGLVGVARRKTS